jgi:hypothetical protein
LAHGQPFKKVLMLWINMLLKSGDAPQEFVDRHIPKVRYAVSGVNKALGNALHAGDPFHV